MKTVEDLVSDEIERMYEVFRDLLDTGTPEEAVKKLEVLRIEQDTIQKIIEMHEQRTIRIRELEEPRSVVLDNRDTWYTGPRPQDKCWPAMVDRLCQDNGWSTDSPSLVSLDTSSTRIVSLLSHPREKQFSTRGLVVGYVQSGKTTNFTAVMSKAADRGYKLFIVLSGIHNGLRRQTQARLVKQLVQANPTRWSQLTGLDKDFTPGDNAAAYFGKSNRTHVLCVVKKNATVLRKLSEWLGSASEYLQDCPALVIDDEADQATVATKSINPLIREILDQLPKSAYVGYTASPFANLLIDPSADNDLYPEHFIVNLPSPKGQGYFGTEVLFGRYALDGEDPAEVDDGYDMIREVSNDDVGCVRPLKRADVEGFSPEITESLRDALRYFWLCTAARRVRGPGNPHNTMLIHTSVNTIVHNSFHAPLDLERRRLAAALVDPAVIDELRGLWAEEMRRVPAAEFGEAAVEFSDVLAELPGVLDDCRVIMDNSSSEDRLDYENGPVVAIAVGGNTLSRGLTLEGLTVSYFVRAVSAYDTLLQMGRWFGFRTGYADLPRIWMTGELQGWFRHLATVEAEMRRDIDVYMTEDKTPMTFAVRLRTHPALRVTAAAKMKNAVYAASAFGGQRVQTRYFHTDAEWLRHNQSAAKELVAKALRTAAQSESQLQDGRFLLRDVPHDHVLDFLAAYRFHEKSQECDAELLSGYIEKRTKVGSLRNWNLAIVGNPVGDAKDNFEFAPDVAVRRIVRAKIDVKDSPSGFADIKTLMSRKDAAIDLQGDTARMTEEEIKAERRRQLPDTGLVVLYPIDKVSEPAPTKVTRRSLDAEEHVIGVGLVFPRPAGDDSTVEWNYISADLSGVDLEEEDFSLIEGEVVG
ncbi:Z1 domain-containing protein [Streptomyces inhibens]|uniref:Z1 domain-containing protein n=1 Tax=Streptomyces inhibens TaxID=2293571 RepID=UPI00369A2344